MCREKYALLKSPLNINCILIYPFILMKMGGRNTVLLDAISCRIPLVSDIPTIIFGADVTHPENGEDSSPSIAAVPFFT